MSLNIAGASVPFDRQLKCPAKLHQLALPRSAAPCTMSVGIQLGRFGTAHHPLPSYTNATTAIAITTATAITTTTPSNSSSSCSSNSNSSSSSCNSNSSSSICIARERVVGGSESSQLDSDGHCTRGNYGKESYRLLYSLDCCLRRP